MIKLRRTRKSKADVTDIWGDTDQGVIEAPNPNKARGIGSPTRARAIKVYVWASVILTPILLITTLSALTAPEVGGGSTSTGDLPAVGSVQAQERAAATVAIQGWLESENAPLPEGEIISWDGSEPAPDAGGEIEYEGDASVHHFTLTGNQGSVYSASVTVFTDPVNGSTVSSKPSILPVAPSIETVPSNLWDGVHAWTSKTEHVSATQLWAQSYLNTDPSKLRQVVGDPRSDHFYMPMVGYKFVDVSVGQGAYHPSQIGRDGFVVNNPDLAFARVVISAIPVLSENPDPVDLTLEVLFQGVTTASPRVVAWGGVGSGPTLKPYGNAIIGRPLVTDQPDTEDLTSQGDTQTSTHSGEDEEAEVEEE